MKAGKRFRALPLFALFVLALGMLPGVALAAEANNGQSLSAGEVEANADGHLLATLDQSALGMQASLTPRKSALAKNDYWYYDKSADPYTDGSIKVSEYYGSKPDIIFRYNGPYKNGAAWAKVPAIGKNISQGFIYLINPPTSTAKEPALELYDYLGGKKSMFSIRVTKTTGEQFARMLVG